MKKKITLYDYLMWIAESEIDITTELIADQLQLEDMDSNQIYDFYKKHKNDELVGYKEEYPTGKYLGMNYYDTKVSFYLGGEHFVLTDVNGSFLHDNKIDDMLDNNVSKVTNEVVIRFCPHTNTLVLAQLVGDIIEDNIICLHNDDDREKDLQDVKEWLAEKGFNF